MITMILFLGIGGYVLAVLLGLHELTIEGAKKRQYGWGRGNMNTSIILKPRNWFLRFFQTVVLLGRPVTEYHIWLNLMLIFGMHVIVIGAIVLSGSYWSWAREVYLWGLYFLWCAVWDYSWFVFSPAYGVKEFKSQDIWWHQRKFKGPVMLDYLEAIISSIVLAVISRYLLGGEVSMINHFAVMACWAILTVVSPYLFVPLYHKVFRYMWLNDEREQLEQMLQQKEK